MLDVERIVPVVLDDSQASFVLIAKAHEYLAAGAKAAWMLEPNACQVRVLTSRNRVAVLEGSKAPLGFSCAVPELFE